MIVPQHMQGPVDHEPDQFFPERDLESLRLLRRDGQGSSPRISGGLPGRRVGGRREGCAAGDRQESGQNERDSRAHGSSIDGAVEVPGETRYAYDTRPERGMLAATTVFAQALIFLHGTAAVGGYSDDFHPEAYACS